MNKAKIITNEIVGSRTTQKLILKILIIMLGLIFAVYAYFIFSITFNILARKSFENTSNILVNEVSNLEIAYLNKANEINKDLVLSLGFVEAEPDIFVTRSISQVAIR